VKIDRSRSKLTRKQKAALLRTAAAALQADHEAPGWADFVEGQGMGWAAADAFYLDFIASLDARADRLEQAPRRKVSSKA